MQNDRIMNEVFVNRVEGYTANLPQAVRSPNSAQFGMLLSLIASSDERRSADVRATTGGKVVFSYLVSLSTPSRIVCLAGTLWVV
ncbi:hypothetical protein [Nitrincola sp. A-D6]|uniref:hypothetical protein n=1 Tax=Nitrincola sp. A-D6 TaxID=1545442 RepID=UPI0005636BE3|nr:hypothetical protein [Nitrincola sp. A-D6]